MSLKYLVNKEVGANGSPIPNPSLCFRTFANIFMCNLERKYTETCPEECSPLFYRRYVDDKCVALRDKNHASLF